MTGAATGGTGRGTMEWAAALPVDFVTAPDGSEIRLLLETPRGGLSHCTLPPWPGMDEAVPIDGHWPVS